MKRITFFVLPETGARDEVANQVFLGIVGPLYHNVFHLLLEAVCLLRKIQVGLAVQHEAFLLNTLQGLLQLELKLR